MNLTVEHLDVLQELINIGVGRAAGVLNEMIGCHISLQVPSINIISPWELHHELEERIQGEQVVAVRLGFTGSFTGTAQMVFPADSASMLVALLTGEEVGTPDLDSVKIGTLSEVGNIVINGVMGSISNVLQQRLDYSLPTYIEGSVDNLLPLPDFAANGTVLVAQTHFTIEQLQISGDFILLFKVGSFNALLSAIDLAVGGAS